MNNQVKIKKAELSTQQIVLLIILIISFIIILFFIFRMNFMGESKKEICRNSVLMRGTSSTSSDALPLKCSREYICITKDGKCEGMVKPEKIKVKTEEEIYAVLAEKMADCWWMFGEGKVDYIGKDFFFKENYCSICSQILFDKSLKEIRGLESGRISKDKLYDYLSKTKILDKNITYLEYIFRAKDINEIKKEISNEELNSQKISTFGMIDIGKQYYLVTGITSEVAGRGWKIGAAVVAAGIGYFLPGVGWTWAGAITGALIVGAGEAGKYFEPEIGALIVQGQGVKNEFMAPTLQEADSEKFKSLNCFEIITTSS